MQNIQLILATSFSSKTYSHRLSHLLVVWSLINELQVFHLQSLCTVKVHTFFIEVYIAKKTPNNILYLDLSQGPLWPTHFPIKNTCWHKGKLSSPEILSGNVSYTDSWSIDLSWGEGNDNSSRTEWNSFLLFFFSGRNRQDKMNREKITNI